MTEIDEESLLANGVNFLPWVGNDYKCGFSNKRLLLLGESHYNAWDEQEHQLGSAFTRECVKAVVSRDANSSNFWRYLEQALLGEERDNGWAASGGSAFWNKLAFYNFIQSPISGGPRCRPSWDMFRASHRAFRAVLEAIRPERVLVCGKGLWEGMEEVAADEDYASDDVQAYRLNDGTRVWCLATVHPSSGRYSWRRIHDKVVAFIDDPARVN